VEKGKFIEQDVVERKGGLVWDSIPTLSCADWEESH